MPEFAYTARTLAGQQVDGVLSAGTQREALATLAAKNLFPVEVKQQAAGPRISLGTRRVPPQVAARFYTQMAALLRSGVPLLRSLEVIGEHASNPVLKEVVADLHQRVSEGDSLADAMARHPRAFNDLARSIVRAGG